MNAKQRTVAILIFAVNLLISGCGTGELFGPTLTPTPTIRDGPTARVIEHTVLSNAVYLDEMSPIEPPDGDQFYAVAIEFEVKGNYSTMLNLDDVKLTAKDESSFSPFTLTFGPGESAMISDLAFYKELGEGGRTLDFGFGFSGMDLSTTTRL